MEGAIPILLRNGFSFHHARGTEAVLIRWLPSEACTLPAYPHTNIGAGAFVLNDAGQVLVVQESSGPTAKWREFWKLPGGSVEQGESLAEGAEREVFEECGIRAKFRSIAAMRESVKSFFGTSDLYIICAMELALPASEQVITPQPGEIAAARWMDLDLFLGSRYYKSNIYGEMLREAAKVCRGLQQDVQPRGFCPQQSNKRKEDTLYCLGDAKL